MHWNSNRQGSLLLLQIQVLASYLLRKQAVLTRACRSTKEATVYCLICSLPRGQQLWNLVASGRTSRRCATGMCLSHFRVTGVCLTPVLLVAISLLYCLCVSNCSAAGGHLAALQLMFVSLLYRWRPSRYWASGVRLVLCL